MRRLWYVMWKEVLELRQDPRLFGVIFIAPVVQLTMLGYAASTDVRDVPIVIVDQDRSARSRELIARFDASPYFTVVGTANNLNDIDPWLEHGRAWMALAIPGDYRDTLGNGRPATVQVVADGTDSNSAGVALGYAANLVASYNLELAERQATAMGRTLPPRPIEARIRVWFNPQLESRDFMIPGIVALLLLVITTNLSSMAIVREKELGTLEQLNVTPVTRWQLILGKLLPYGLIGLIDVVVVSLAAVLWFEIPLLGQPMAAVWHQRHLPADHAGAGAVHLDDLEHAAAGDDDGDVLLPHADAVPFGVHLPDREHAGRHPADHLSDPAAVLHRDRARHLPEGGRPGGVVAADPGAAGMGPGDCRPGGGEISEDARLI